MTLPKYESPTEAAPSNLSVRKTKTQRTRRGHQIPVPSKSQIMRDFEKIATRRSSDDEDDNSAQDSGSR